MIKENAAAYLQHLCYNDDNIKSKTRSLNGIAYLVALLQHEKPEIQKNACGALRNLCYGKRNDENKVRQYFDHPLRCDPFFFSLDRIAVTEESTVTFDRLSETNKPRFRRNNLAC